MLNILELSAGTGVQLVDGRYARVTENMGDAMWVAVREEGSHDSELAHAQDTKHVIKK